MNRMLCLGKVARIRHALSEGDSRDRLLPP
jgi:hypothetical protein